MKTSLILVLFIFSYLTIQAQDGYYKTAKDYELNNLTVFDEVKFVTGAFGTRVNFFRNGEKICSYNEKDMFAFRDEGRTFRFYDDRAAQVYVKGAISYYGTFAGEIKFNGDAKTLYTETSMPLISKGVSGELIRFTYKSLRETASDDPELLEKTGTRSPNPGRFIISYNLRHPVEHGFVAVEGVHYSYEEIRKRMDINE